MVRQDKITYIITYFNVLNGQDFKQIRKKDWLDRYLLQFKIKLNSSSYGALISSDFSPILNKIKSMVYDNENFVSDVLSTRLLYRIGIVQSNDNVKVSEEMTKFTPYGRSFFLFYNLHNLSAKICIAFNPMCYKCELTKICDFYNKKNNWKIF